MNRFNGLFSNFTSTDDELDEFEVNERLACLYLRSYANGIGLFKKFINDLRDMYMCLFVCVCVSHIFRGIFN